MANAMTPVRSSAELYPPGSSDEVFALRRLLTNEWRDGKPVILRPLSTNERAALATRINVLSPFVRVGADNRRVKIAIGAMMTGFGGRKPDGDDAEIMIAQYVGAMRDLPAWAVERACNRFAIGSVAASELGQREISRDFGPTTAQLHIIALAIFAPIKREYEQISSVLRGVQKPPEPSPEERARMAEAMNGMVAEFVHATAASNLERDIEDVRRQESLRRRQRDQIEARRAEYLAAGLSPPAGETFTSLPMMLKMGWSIQDLPDGERALVDPGRANLVSEER